MVEGDASESIWIIVGAVPFYEVQQSDQCSVHSQWAAVITLLTQIHWFTKLLLKSQYYCTYMTRAFSSYVERANKPCVNAMQTFATFLVRKRFQIDLIQIVNRSAKTKVSVDAPSS